MYPELDNLQFQIRWLQTVLAQGYELPKGFVGHKILPWWSSPESWKTFRAPIFGAENRRIHNAKHALRTEMNTVTWQVEYKDVTLDRYGLRAPRDPDEIAAAGTAGINMIDLDHQAIWLGVETEREYDTSVLLQNTASYAVGHSTGTTEKWDAKTGTVSDYNPLVDMRSDMNVIRRATGSLVNTIMFGYTAWETLIDNSYVRAAVFGDGPERPITTADISTQIGGIPSGDGTMSIDVFVAYETYLDPASNPLDPNFLDYYADNVMYYVRRPDFSSTGPSTWYGATLAQTVAEVDGMPITGIFGSYESHPNLLNETYGGWWKIWTANNRAGFLRLAVNT